jgi:hypothetical protein
MHKALVYLHSFVLVFSLIACNSDKKDEKKEEPRISIDPAISDAALLLGGVTPAIDSDLAPFAESREYLDWAASINSAWQKTQVSNLSLIADWREQIANKYPTTIFSPFSGPDILNAIAFFPDGIEYILFGLEPAGRVPHPEVLEPGQLMLELRHLRNALGDILSNNFFHTLKMKEQVREDSCSSFAGIIMFFLTRLDMEVISARNISIDTNGILIDHYDPRDGKLVPGVEFKFHAGNGDAGSIQDVPANEIRTVRHFSLHIPDAALSRKDNFERYARMLPLTTTIIKSASFLMHKDYFSRIRTLVLERSLYILQDDSGVPLRFFLNDNWTVDYFGFYERPIPLFANYFQRELRANMREKSSGRLPFSYGYDHARGTSNLILAKKLVIQ